MKRIFESREFSNYRTTSVNESLGPVQRIRAGMGYFTQKTTVFLSHKHDDLEDLCDIIGFLEKNYNVNVYIDSQDPSLPRTTDGETAARIKERIKQCDRFILLATDNAIDSKWCNWELGFGDAHKYQDKIAIFPIKPKDGYDYKYKGNEYMALYPYIAYYDGTEKYDTGNLVPRGYYVCTEKNNSCSIIPLNQWL